MRKLFDFNTRKDPGFILGRPWNLAWPCNLFRVTLPKSKRNSRRSVNVFELCILKLLAYGRYEPKDLAKETCLPLDLIKVILLRLVDTGKIDNYYHVNPETLTDIEKYDEEKESTASEYETWVIFQECVSGTLLPMLVDAHLQAEEVNEKGKLVIRDPKKGEQIIPLNHLGVKIKDADPPTTQDVLSAIETMHRRSIMSEESYSVPTAEFVTVSSDSEQCELRVRMVIQKNSVDWRILNPFGKGWSLELESAYQKLLKEDKKEAEKFQNWQKNLIDNFKDIKKEDNIYKALFDTPDNRNRYPELIRTLNRWPWIDVYAALEWALFYALKECESTRQTIQQLQVDSVKNNQSRLQEAVNNLAPEENWIPISSPSPKRILGFQDYDKAEMQVLLPLAFLVANSDPLFAFNLVLKAYPEFLARYKEIKDARDEYMHGNSRVSQPYGDNDYVLMRDVISTLIPTVRFSEMPQESDDADDTIDDFRLNARIALQEFFGVSLFDQMDNILQRELINVEVFRGKTQQGEVDALPCINYLYSAAQCAFRPLLRSDNSNKESDPISAAQKNAKNAGWGELPQSLQKIRPDLLRQTLEGNDQTLGASIVVWLLRTDLVQLSNIANKVPDFIQNIDKLLSLRNHGNASFMIDKEELNNCIENIYKIIRTILEA